MKIKTGSLIACLFAGMITQAQIAFNTTGASANTSAMLDVTSTTKGLLVPRMTIAERTAIASPATGLLVYDNSLSLFYFYNGTTWTAITPPANAWSLSGNSGTISGTDFLGTTDNQSLDISGNNTRHIRIRTTGQIEVLNTGRSVYLGENTAPFEDMNNRSNTGIGYSSLRNMVSGTGNTAAGTLSQQIGKADYNTTAGYFALGSATCTGVSNTALGRSAMSSTTTGSYNVSASGQTLRQNTAGNYNVAIGGNSLFNNSTGSYNIGLGNQATRSNSTGNYNLGIGTLAYLTPTMGNENMCIGNWANVTVDNLTNASAIGHNAAVAQSNSLILGGTGGDAVNVGIGTPAPISTLEVTGAGSMAIKSGQVAGTNDPDNTASVWRYTSGTGNITLPDATTYANRLYMIVNQTGSALNISSYNDLSGTAQTTLNTGASIMIVSDGANWLQIR